jgi:AcrR family transcriptional regulator
MPTLPARDASTHNCLPASHSCASYQTGGLSSWSNNATNSAGAFGTEPMPWSSARSSMARPSAMPIARNRATTASISSSPCQRWSTKRSVHGVGSGTSRKSIHGVNSCRRVWVHIGSNRRRGGAGRSGTRQERSRLMVARILDAGRTVLIKHGYDGTTTNLIAKSAGISPGSLYQYFPNKDVIIAAIVDDYTDQIARTVTTHLVEHVGKPAELGTMRQTLAVLLDAMSEQPELLRAMIDHTPRLGLGNKIVDFERRVGELALAHLQLRDQRPEHPNTVVWIAIRAVEHLAIRYVLDQPPIDHDEFLDELTALFGRYVSL